jgi:hypothetical protein
MVIDRAWSRPGSSAAKVVKGANTSAHETAHAEMAFADVIRKETPNETLVRLIKGGMETA